MSKPDPMEPARRSLERWQRKRKMSDADLAIASGIKYADRIYRIKTGEYTDALGLTWIRLADALGITLDALLSPDEVLAQLEASATPKRHRRAR